MKHTVALVDDHQLFREGLNEIINDFRDFKVILNAGSGDELIAKLKVSASPDIILLDINMKGMDGFETAKWLRSNHPDTKVLALSMYGDENSIVRMIKNGARGFLLKDIRKQQLHEALILLMQKGYFHSELLTGSLIRAITNSEDMREQTGKEHVSITTNELEFLRLCCSELTYKEIAVKMSLSVHTIDGYRDCLFEKLQLRSRVGLVLYAIRNRIYFVE